MFELGRARKFSAAPTGKKRSTDSHDNHENLIRGFPLWVQDFVLAALLSPGSSALRWLRRIYLIRKNVVSCLSRSDNNK